MIHEPPSASLTMNKIKTLMELMTNKFFNLQNLFIWFVNLQNLKNYFLVSNDIACEIQEP